ncbi:ABC transporter ATP-binding protein [Haploplasma modicum]|uniref:ABC transporter ATP-binding protein n=1 Tax=Haploplasma modicum TaxID=2150 RepID=UPI00214B21E4|nr:ABC transporter ATP-binding protein [Haploplasma modicum]MCR1809197.1 ABC transporter ATP-binding protein/permease [Haploplasma modicum]
MENNHEDLLESKISLGVWKKVFSIVKKLKGKIIVLVLLAITLALFDALVNVINVYAIDNFIEAKDLKTLPIYIIFNIFFALGFGLLVFYFVKQGSEIEARVNYEFRKEAFDNLQRLSFDYFDKNAQGWIMARMTSDSKKLANIISWSLVDFFWSALFMIFTLVVLFLYSVKLALIVLVSIPLMFIIAILFRKKILKSHRESRKYNSIATAKYSEAFLGAKTTKTLGIEDDNLEEFGNVINDLRRSSIRAISISALFSSIILFATYSVLGIVMYAGSSLVLNDAIKISTLFLFIRATVSFFDPIIMITNIMSSIQQAQASAERIVALIEETPQITDKEEVILKYGDTFNPIKENYETIIGDVEYRNVNFSYNEGEVILDNFNLKINAGMKVAFVGHTGSGKTTLINLLARFYEPTSGEILIDGIDYKDRSINWLHSQIGYVLQSPHLFSTTIRENIKYGKLEAEDEEMIEVAKEVGIHDFIMSLDNKYDTHVGEGGNLLSLGQKQLISFARALLNDPKILILDEATSSIDSESEKKIIEATKKLLSNRTSLTVAHRLSTIVDSDLIVMLEFGKIIEIGTHKELLKNKGLYYNLYRDQFLAEREKELN